MSQPTPDADLDLWWANDSQKEQIAANAWEFVKQQGIVLPANLPLRVIHEVAGLVSMVWVDGQPTPRGEFHIDPFDDGLLFGRGVWESTRTVKGYPWLWSMHVHRMEHTAQVLNFKLDPERIPTREQVREFVHSLTDMEVVIRVNVSAGVPGYPGRVWMTASLPPKPVTSVSLCTTRYPFLKSQPYLVWKTFQYATRLQINQDAKKAGFDSALLLDEDENILEAVQANIFLRMPDGWITPTADGGLLPGTTRQFLMTKGPYPVREQAIPVNLLRAAQEVYITGSNVGITPVTRIDDYQYPIGPETQQLLVWIEQN